MQIGFMRDGLISNMIVNQTFNVCELINGTATNPFFGWIKSLTNLFVSTESLKSCNFLGHYKIKLDPIEFPSTFNFLKGPYKCMFTWYNSKDPNIDCLG